MSDSAPDNMIEPAASTSPSGVSAEFVVGETPARPGWWKQHLWPLIGTAALLVCGMGFSLFWNIVIHHVGVWETPPDLWNTFRDAHYVIWDGEGQVYNANTSFVTFPGIAVLLAPVAELQSMFHLTQSYPIFLLKPTAWYVLGPVDLLCGGVLLFPLDAMARRLSIPYWRRGLATLLETVLIFPAIAYWGHPEDTLALAFALYGLMAGFDRRWLHSAGFFALAVAFQPLTLLILPIALAYVPAKKWPAYGGIVALPSVLLLIAPLVQQWKATTYAILKQPNFPTIDHATPWLSLAPVLSPTQWRYTYGLKVVRSSTGKEKLVYAAKRFLAGEVVQAGPGRTIALVLACLVGVWVARRRPPLVQVAWWAAFALGLRCVFESVMDPYYLVPTLVLLIVVASTLGKTRFIVTVAIAAFCTKTSYWHTGEWRYYLLVVGSLLLALVVSWPGQSPQKSADNPAKLLESVTTSP